MRPGESWTDYIKEKWDENAAMSLGRWQDYYNNIAFAEGYQWQSFNAQMMGFSQAPVEDPSTERLYFSKNLIRPLIEGRVSKILSNRPVLQVTTNDKTSQNINLAVKNTKILKALWEDLNMQTLLVQALHWSVVTNHVFLHFYHDPEYGREIKNKEYDPEMAESYGEEYDEPDHFHLGRMRCDIINPFELVFDTTYSTWRDVIRYGWILMKTIKSIDELYNQYPEELVDKIKPVPIAGVSTVDEQLLQLTDRTAFEQRQKDKTKKGKYRTCEVYNFYQAPCHDYPEGKHLVVCQDVVLYDGEDTEEEMPSGKIPIVMIRDQVSSKSLWGQSMVTASRGPQKQYNVLLSKCMEHARLPAMWFVPHGSGLDGESLPGKSYFIVEYDAEDGTPQAVPPPDIPKTIPLMMNDIELGLEHFWSSHEVSNRATPPSKGSSGRSIFLLQESDTTKLSTTMSMFSEALSDMGDIMLAIARTHYVDERKLSFKSSVGNQEPITFTGDKDILSEYKVTVEVGSEFQRNKQAMMNFVTQLLSTIGTVPSVAAVLNDPMVFHKLLSFIDEELANILMIKNQDAETAEKENQMIMEGKPVKVEFWHGHVMHIKSHLSFMNTQEYRDMPQDQQEWLAKVHLQEHLQYFNSGLQAQAQAQSGQIANDATQFEQQAEASGDPMRDLDAEIEGKVQPSGQQGTEQIP